ncbi:MAG: redoxin domain-containing protein [Methanomassiliicoccales archaeon]|jgi:peroxiredoxin
MSGDIEVGKQAPDFDLPTTGTTGRAILSDIVKKGVAVILFYPSDWGYMCAVEMRTFKDMFQEFEKAGAILLPISTNSIVAHRAWREQMRLQFDLLSDFDGKVSNKYEVLIGGEGYLKGRSNRAVFVIDGNKILRYKWIAEDASFEPDYDSVLDAVKKTRTES